VPYQASVRLPGSIQRGNLSAVSPPFSLCVPAADLTVSLDDGASSATPGGPITYTLTVANAGPEDAPGVGVVDDLPAALTGVAWTCATGGGGGSCAASGVGDLDESVDLPAGGSVVFTIQATVDPSASGTLADTASASLPAGLHALGPDDDAATDLDVLVPSTDLSITDDDGLSSAELGQTVTYVVVVANSGPSDAVAAQVEDLLPPSSLIGVAWTCVGAGGGTCPPSGSGDLEESVDLPVGASATFEISGRVSVAAVGPLVTSATVYPSLALATTDPSGLPVARTGFTLDPDLSNNSASDTDLLVDTTIFTDGFETGDVSHW